MLNSKVKCTSLELHTQPGHDMPVRKVDKLDDLGVYKATNIFLDDLGVYTATNIVIGDLRLHTATNSMIWV